MMAEKTCFSDGSDGSDGRIPKVAKWGYKIVIYDGFNDILTFNAQK